MRHYDAFYDPDGHGGFALPLDFCDQDRVPVLGTDERCGADWTYTDYGQIDLAAWRAAGVQHVLLDLDGNLTPAYHHHELTPEVLGTLEAMRDTFDTVSLATNNEWPLEKFQQRFGLDHVFQPYQPDTELPYKPDPQYFRHILQVLGVVPEAVVMVGDNPEHDVQGAQTCGMRAVLVHRLDPYGFFDE